MTNYITTERRIPIKGRVFSPGRVIDTDELGLTERDVEILLNQQAIMTEEPSWPAAESEDDTAEENASDAVSEAQSDGEGDGDGDAPTAYPVHTGSGWYTLSDGSTVRGEDNALAAQAELDEEG